MESIPPNWRAVRFPRLVELLVNAFRSVLLLVYVILCVFGCVLRKNFQTHPRLRTKYQ